MTVVGSRDRSQEGFLITPFGLDSWTCYHHNGTRRLGMLHLPVLLLNNKLDDILGNHYGALLT